MVGANHSILRFFIVSGCLLRGHLIFPFLLGLHFLCEFIQFVQIVPLIQGRCGSWGKYEVIGHIFGFNFQLDFSLGLRFALLLILPHVNKIKCELLL